MQCFLTDLGRDLIIEVEDSGRGIAPEVADSLLENGAATHSSTGFRIPSSLAAPAIGNS